MESTQEKNSKKRKLFDDSPSPEVNDFKVNKKYAKTYYEKNAQTDFIACMLNLFFMFHYFNL